MLLLIDEKKIKEQLSQTFPSYSVSAFNLEIPIEGYPIPTVDVFNAVIVPSPESEKARDRLMRLRESLFKSGNKALSREELERVIDETRGR